MIKKYTAITFPKLMSYGFFIISSCAPIMSYIMGYFFGLPGPQFYASLSIYGIKRFYIWQIFTYPFFRIYGSEFSEQTLLVNFLYAILLFKMYDLVSIKIAKRPLLLLTFLQVIFISSGTLLVMLLTNNRQILSGIAPLICSLATAYLILNKNKVILVPPFSVKIPANLIFILSIFIFFSRCISSNNFISIASCILGIAFPILLRATWHKIYSQNPNITSKIKNAKFKVLKK